MERRIFPEDTDRYAFSLADSSYDWYRIHAIRSRKTHKLTELLVVVLSAAIPVSGLVANRNAIAPSAIGATVFILVGLRSTFHWHENYLRFSQAREAVEAERRRFLVDAQPYNDPAKRAELLVDRVTAIEQEEMGMWLKIASTKATDRSVTRTVNTDVESRD
jgi:hypothetical protein